MTTATSAAMPEIGDRVPAIELQPPAGQSGSVTPLTGRSIVLLFYPALDLPELLQELRGFDEAADELERFGVRVLAVVPADPAAHEQFVTTHAPRTPVLNDPQRALANVYGLRDATQPATRTGFLIDPGHRIVQRYEAPPAAGTAADVLADVRRHLAPEEPRQLLMHAPVLIVPNVLPLELCKRLIQIWQDEGNVDSGSMVMRNGQTVPVYNYDHKIRRDHFMKESPDEALVKKLIGRRLLPEVRKAFNYNVTRREDFRIACYDSTRGGYFRPHRDNTTEGTAHRRFAMSLMLNDDYEGGYLRFPEFGPHTYRPSAGSAVVFSCSLLHEATDVTAGRRFVLLSFFYGEAEARIREEYNKRTGGNYRA